MGNKLRDVNTIIPDIWGYWYIIRSSILLRSMQILVITSGGYYKASVFSTTYILERR